MVEKKRLLIIVGPTASGKSALAVQLAKKFDGEIISADSRQVYRGLDIGTGKITKAEMKGVKHHLLDVADPRKIYTAQNFVSESRQAISMIYHREKLPIICGGSGFYIDALVGRMPLPNVDPNPALRKELETLSVDELFDRLKRIDARRATTVDKMNKRRLIRAIEIARALGRNPLPTKRDDYDALWIGIAPPPEVLRKKINLRLAERLKKGMVAEAQRLHRGGLSYKRMEVLGLEYRSLARYLQKKIDRKTLEEELQSAIWHYAKRQQTYWRRNKLVHWYAPNQQKDTAKEVSKWLGQKI